jgi:type I restriction enzyme M protein
MTVDTKQSIEKLENDLWSAADNLRANSKLTSSDYFMPVLGVIFLRHAANRFEAAQRQIADDQAAGRMPRRPLVPEDFVRRRALWLPDEARYDVLMQRAASDRAGLPARVNAAMEAIEREFEPLRGVLPKDYGIFDPTVLEDLMRTFDSEEIRRATGDVFGRIYEYFLAKFSIQKAHDNGEFFTPSSLVQLIVHVIEPDHGTVFDPACGSGGMFVQSSHFIEEEGEDTTRRVTFYGQEKNPDTIRLAKMNLAVHGLDGRIAEAITYYNDAHTLVGGCDFVMANPPFNVDLVDAEQVKGDPRLPFGLPGVNKQKKVGNANYLWISYFWSYLNATGRAGFVMSSQASSAGHGEKEVRRKLVESGDVDVMISIGSNFFYTRTVPCELWFFDRAKPADRCDQVLMLDARGIFRKVSRTVNDFSYEQLRNLSAIVWLYRGQKDRFLALVRDYVRELCDATAEVSPVLDGYERSLADVRLRVDALSSADGFAAPELAHREPLQQAVVEWNEAHGAYASDRASLAESLAGFVEAHGMTLPETNDAQHAARAAFASLTESVRGLGRQVELLYKLASRAVAAAGDVVTGERALGEVYERRAVGRLLKELEERRREVSAALHRVTHVFHQIDWLEKRFPDAELCDVPGLVKLTSREAIAAADWSLTPGRYVGVAPEEVDGEFDFDRKMREIRDELRALDSEASDLALQIQRSLSHLVA